jgi:hypothetical protein
MSDEHTNKFVCVLKTGKLFEHDLASNALTEHGIPFHKQLETSSGLRLAMPFQPSMGPGTWYNILVQYRNPGPLGQVRVQWLCHLNDSFVTNKA